MSELFARKCAGKKRHESERKAEEWAKKTKKYTGCAMNVYACEFCKQFHVGNAMYGNGKLQREEREAA